MNNPEDYASDTDSDDCDFNPDVHDSHAESEEEEDDVLDKKSKAKNKKLDESKETTTEDEPQKETEESKKKVDDLWASFQEDVKDDKVKEPINGSNSSSASSSSTSKSEIVRKPATQLPLRKPPTFPPTLKRPASGGLGNILSQIGKKNKLSVLEQSKKDWNSFKDEEGLKEELETYNKGKDG